MTSYNDSVVVPGLSHAATFSWRGDNAGPPESVQEVLDDFNYIRTQFPGANVFASTLDNFTQLLNAPAIVATLPRVTAEYGDTWLHGAASDPFKTAMNARASTLLVACLDNGGCSMGDPIIANFTRLLLKNPEHTWGKSHAWLNDQITWSNVDLQAALAKGLPNFLDTVASWQEQRDWGLGYPLQALEGHPLQAAVAEAWADLYPPVPPPTPSNDGWVPFSPGGPPQEVGEWGVGFDPLSGALSLLTHQGSGGDTVAWVNTTQDPLSVFFAAEYQTYDNASINEWMNLYNSANLPGWISTPGCGFSDWCVCLAPTLAVLAAALGLLPIRVYIYALAHLFLPLPPPPSPPPRQVCAGIWKGEHDPSQAHPHPPDRPAEPAGPVAQGSPQWWRVLPCVRHL